MTLVSSLQPSVIYEWSMVYIVYATVNCPEQTELAGRAQNSVESGMKFSYQRKPEFSFHTRFFAFTQWYLSIFDTPMIDL